MYKEKATRVLKKKTQGTCYANYPKNFSNKTKKTSNGFPKYKRRNNSHTIQINNRNVVPYNTYLCKKFNAHINVEICSSLIAVKYLYKYTYKGSDTAIIRFNKKGNTIKRNTNEMKLRDL